MARKRRSAIFWIDADKHTQPPSFVWYALRGAVVLERFPVRALTFPVRRRFAACGPRMLKSGSSSGRSITCPQPPLLSASRSAIIAAAAPERPATLSARDIRGRPRPPVAETFYAGETGHPSVQGAEP